VRRIYGKFLSLAVITSPRYRQKRTFVERGGVKQFYRSELLAKFCCGLGEARTMNVKRVFKDDVALQELMESAIYLYCGILENHPIGTSVIEMDRKSVTHKTTYSNLKAGDQDD
jgi:hypothetical protein